MTKIDFREWELNVDRELTKLTYDNAPLVGPNTCLCLECDNFVKTLEIAYPDEIKQLFIELGIDYKNECEVCHYCRQENGLHLYSGWFHFKGNFKGKNCKIQTGENSSTFDLTPITENFSIGFCYDSGLALFDSTENLVQIEFETKIPWTIENE